jgi:hypothetical protein
VQTSAQRDFEEIPMGKPVPSTDRHAQLYGDCSAPDWPATRAAAVTPDDDADLPFIPREIYVGTGGDLVLNLVESGTNVTFKNVANGARLPYRAVRIREATTATDIVILD